MTDEQQEFNSNTPTKKDSEETHSESVNLVCEFHEKLTQKIRELGYIRAKLRLDRPSILHLIIPLCNDEQEYDPDQGHKEWGQRLERELNVTLPGDWDTDEGRKIRKNTIQDVCKYFC